MGRKNKRKRHPVEEMAIDTILEQHKRMQEQALAAHALQEQVNRQKSLKKPTTPKAFERYWESVEDTKSIQISNWTLVAIAVVSVLLMVGIAVIGTHINIRG